MVMVPRVSEEAVMMCLSPEAEDSHSTRSFGRRGNGASTGCFSPEDEDGHGTQGFRR